MEKYVPVNQAVKTFEPINGPDETLSPIIFLHNIGGSKEMWDDIPQIIANRTKRKCYAYDARDHGDSEWTDHFSFHIILDDLLYFMDSKDIKKTILIGHSMGGWVTSILALKVPQRFELLILEDSYPRDLPVKMIINSIEYMNKWQKALQSVPKGLDESEAIRLALDNIYAQIPPHLQKYFSKKETLCKYKFPIKQLQDGSYDVKHNMKLIQNIDTSLSDQKPEGTYDGPVCVIYGNRSFVKIYDHEEEIRRHFPHAEMILFDGATHNVHIDFPEKFVETVLNFLTKHLGSSRRYSF